MAAIATAANEPQSRQPDNQQQQQEEQPKENGSPPPECEVFADYGKNYLTPVDVVVKNSDNNVACIKARFALSIKVEEQFNLSPKAMGQMTNSSLNDGHSTIRSILGYLPLEHVLSVEDSCPEPAKSKPATTTTNGKTDDSKVELNGREANAGAAKKTDETANELALQELEMIVTFACGKLSFTLKRDEKRIFVSSIKGVVKLGEFLLILCCFEYTSTREQ